MCTQFVTIYMHTPTVYAACMLRFLQCVCGKETEHRFMRPWPFYKNSFGEQTPPITQFLHGSTLIVMPVHACHAMWSRVCVCVCVCGGGGGGGGGGSVCRSASCHSSLHAVFDMRQCNNFGGFFREGILIFQV